jgi:nucleotide-binding universal stress UspA family protein
MLQSLLVPIDGSPFAEQALGVAQRIARKSGATLEVVLVHQPMPSILAPHSTPVHDPSLDIELRKEAQSYLASVAERLGRESTQRVTPTFIEGPVAESLLRHIRETSPSLVVMTTHARSGLSQAWMGRVADRLVRRASAPVLLVRPAKRAPGLPAGPPFPRVLIPLDGAPGGDEIIPYAVDVAGTKGVEYTLLRVLDKPGTRAWRATIEAALAAEAETLRSRGLTVRTRVVVHEDAARGILDYANEAGADLIAMVTRSRGGLERLLMGSVTDEVLHKAGRPMLCLNAYEAGVAHGTAVES